MVKVLWVELPNKTYDEYKAAVQKKKGDTRKGWMRENTIEIIQKFIDENRSN